MKTTLLSLTIVTVFLISVAFQTNKTLDQIITTALVEKHITILASDEMEGRKAGTPGIEKAAVYIENEFEKLELKPFQSSEDYRQRFTKKNLELFNVIGVLEGRSKKDEFVVVSAHYDHLGIIKGNPKDSIANGADDDASGVAAVLSLARYWKKRGDNERSIIFVAFTAEEKGLWGSNYFGKQVNPESIIAGINIEMIGKDSKFGSKTAWLTGFYRSDFGEIIQKNIKDTEYKLYPDPYPNFGLFYRSDNASLARLGIPAHTFSTDPIDTDKFYHTVDDEIETLNIETVATTIRAIALGTESIIMGVDTPTRIK